MVLNADIALSAAHTGEVKKEAPIDRLRQPGLVALGGKLKGPKADNYNQ